MSQSDLAAKAEVKLRFACELEQSKLTLLDKAREVLRLFGHELATAPALPYYDYAQRRGIPARAISELSAPKALSSRLLNYIMEIYNILALH